MAHGHWASPEPWPYTEMARRVAGDASWQTPASGTGTNSSPSTGPCSWKASPCTVLSPSKEWAVSEAAGAKHVNVLQHLMGYLKKHLSGEDKAYLQ